MDSSRSLWQRLCHTIACRSFISVSPRANGVQECGAIPPIQPLQELNCGHGFFPLLSKCLCLAGCTCLCEKYMYLQYSSCDSLVCLFYYCIYSLKFSRFKNFAVFVGCTVTTKILSHERFSTCIRTHAL